MSGWLPPGVTDRMIDAQSEDERAWHECPRCGLWLDDDEGCDDPLCIEREPQQEAQ